jgi:iron-sulfur cluster assembly protein
MITVTASAVERIRDLLEKNQIQGGLRLGIVGGGCSGLSYKFKFETSPRPTDKVFEVDGVKLIVDPKSYEYLDGMTLDFHNTLMEQAFVFHNPKATKSCGCGKSFQVS